MDLIRLQNGGSVWCDAGGSLVGMAWKMQHLAGVVQGRRRGECMNHYRPLRGQWKMIGRVNHLCIMVAQSYRLKRASRCLSRDRSAFQIVRILDIASNGG